MFQSTFDGSMIFIPLIISRQFNKNHLTKPLFLLLLAYTLYIIYSPFI